VSGTLINKTLFIEFPTNEVIYKLANAALLTTNLLFKISDCIEYTLVDEML